MSSASSPAPAVVARNLVKRFGATTAVRGIDLTLPSTGVVGLLGPNGAGKTTTIRMIAGVLQPDEGDLRVCGLDARREAARARAQIGYLPESAPLHPELTVAEALAFRAQLAGLAGRRARTAVDGAMARTDVARFQRRCCGTLSKGMQQRVGLAAAILADPRILILDEPSVGLDPEQVLAFRALVSELGRSRLVLFSSHLLSEVETLASELLVIAHGRVLAHESLERFRARAGGSALIEVESAAPVALDGPLAARAAVRAARAMADGWHHTELEVHGGDATAVREELARALQAQGIVVRTLRSDAPGLERVFVDLVRGAARADAASTVSEPSGVAR